LEARGLWRGGLLLLALSILRLGVISLTGQDPVLTEGESELPRLLEESLEAKAEAARRNAPLAAGETLDPNRSEEEDLDRLPGIGPSTAKAIIAARRARGGFWKAEDLLDVKGIGPVTLEKIRPHLSFSAGVPQTFALPAGPAETSSPAPGGPSEGSASQDQGQSLPRPARVDLNQATARELESLPGIGPKLAQRIVEDRQRAGLFLKPEDLLRVRGIGPATLARIRNLVLPRG
jgi:competence protein ComEA